VLLAIGLLILYGVLRTVHPAEVATAIRGAHLGWVLIAELAFLGFIVVRGWRWLVILRASAPDASFGDATAVTGIGFALNAVSPFKLGELLRIGAIAPRAGIGVGEASATVVVERVLAVIHGIDEPRVLDVGVGSGAIALAIAAEHSGAHVTGVDTSPAALELAAENAALLGLEVDLRPGGSESAAEGWDLVVANPPYIPQAALSAPQPELLWEPREALLDVGLHDEIARAAVTRWLVFEVGEGQADGVAQTLGALGYTDIRITNDLTGVARVVEGRRA